MNLSNSIVWQPLTDAAFHVSMLQYLKNLNYSHFNPPLRIDYTIYKIWAYFKTWVIVLPICKWLQRKTGHQDKKSRPLGISLFFWKMNRRIKMWTHHAIDIKMLGGSSHQYQSPAFEKTAIRRPTKMPLYPYRPFAIAPLRQIQCNTETLAQTFRAAKCKCTTAPH